MTSLLFVSCKISSTTKSWISNLGMQTQYRQKAT